MSISPYQIFIGYDPRESKAFDVCKYSVERRGQSTLEMRPSIEAVKLYSKEMPEYKRDWGEPQSTDFTFTRFWVPYLSGYKGVSMFCDCDFLFRANPYELIKQAKARPEIALWVVQHPEYVPNTLKKMDGVIQHRSYRKNWCSLMVFNNEHPKNRMLEPEYLNNHQPGKDFHSIRWLEDNEIGALPLEWNCLDDYYYLENPKAIHFTDGGPWFNDYTNTFYSDLWLEEYQQMLLKRDGTFATDIAAK